MTEILKAKKSGGLRDLVSLPVFEFLSWYFALTLWKRPRHGFGLFLEYL
jgi:hypothetical protein